MPAINGWRDRLVSVDGGNRWTGVAQAGGCGLIAHDPVMRLNNARSKCRWRWSDAVIVAGAVDVEIAFTGMDIIFRWSVSKGELRCAGPCTTG